MARRGQEQPVEEQELTVEQAALSSQTILDLGDALINLQYKVRALETQLKELTETNAQQEQRIQALEKQLEILMDLVQSITPSTTTLSASPSTLFTTTSDGEDEKDPSASESEDSDEEAAGTRLP